MSSEALAAYNAANMKAKATAVSAAVRRLQESGVRVTFYSVAEASGVSRSTLYRNTVLRSVVEQARAECGRTSLEARVARLEVENARLCRELDAARSERRAPSSSIFYYVADLPILERCA